MSPRSSTRPEVCEIDIRTAVEDPDAEGTALAKCADLAAGVLCIDKRIAGTPVKHGDWVARARLCIDRNHSLAITTDLAHTEKVRPKILRELLHISTVNAVIATDIEPTRLLVFLPKHCGDILQEEIIRFYAPIPAWQLREFPKGLSELAALQHFQLMSFRPERLMLLALEAKQLVQSNGLMSDFSAQEVRAYTPRQFTLRVTESLKGIVERLDPNWVAPVREPHGVEVR